MIKEDTSLWIEKNLLFRDNGRYPVRVVAIDRPWHFYKRRSFTLRFGLSDFYCIHCSQYTALAVDLSSKAM